MAWGRLEQAKAELKSFARQIERSRAPITGFSLDLERVRDAVLRELCPALLVLLGAGVLVLLIAYANAGTSFWAERFLGSGSFWSAPLSARAGGGSWRRSLARVSSSP